MAIIDWYSHKVLSWRLSNSMDGRGRALDNIFVERLWRNVKYEDVYLKGYANMGELMVGLTHYFSFYNNERPDQAPSQIYQSAQGGGAIIVDRFTKKSGTQGEADSSRCVQFSVRLGEKKIMQFIEAHNENPKPFVWTKPVGEIMAKINRARLALSNATGICTSFSAFFQSKKLNLERLGLRFFSVGKTEPKAQLHALTPKFITPWV